MKARQLHFGSATKQKFTFGGSNLKGNAREKRPFHKHMYCHTVMRSRLAVGERSMLRTKNKVAIEQLVRASAQKFSVQLKRYVNVGNHLHLLIKAPTRQAQANFFRSIAGLIVRQVMGVQRGSAGKFQRFWDAKPFTRLVNSWGKAYRAVTHYLALNSLEAIGFSKAQGKEYLKTFSTA